MISPNGQSAVAPPSRWVIAFCALLLGVGFVARIAPLLDRDGRLLRQWPTEDGYLMQTIARNMALGLGMSTAAGTIPTNGTQPLFTFVSAGLHALAAADKTRAMLFVQLVSVLIASAAAWVLWRLGRLVLGSSRDGSVVAALAASVWFASANGVRHSMNALETGLYALVALLIVYAFVLLATRPVSRPWLGAAGLGILLGAAFWTRNDAVFLVLAACLARLTVAPAGPASGVVSRLRDATLMGAVAVAVATPWLWYNYTSFGHIMPISGQSQSLHARLGGNLGAAVVNLTEYISVVFQLPRRLEGDGRVVLACGALILCTAAGLVQVLRRGTPQQKAAAWLAGLFSLFLVAFYGGYFGAGYFMSRYLFVLSPLLALLVVGAACRALGSQPERRRVALGAAAAVAALAAIVPLNVRLYRHGTNNMHFQVVDWVSENVAADAWVGAVQTGTLGYFHDRTINLDGKVNPEALAAESQGRLLQYVADGPIQYLADWVGIVEWARDPQISSQFTVLVEDPERNLGVLGRTQLATGEGLRPSW